MGLQVSLRAASNYLRESNRYAADGDHKQAFASLQLAVNELTVSLEQAWISINAHNAEHSAAETAGE